MKTELDKLICVRSIDVPDLGFCFMMEPLNAESDTPLTVVQTDHVRGYTKERKDDEGKRYDIENVIVKIELQRMLADVWYNQKWIDGYVDNIHKSYQLKRKEYDLGDRVNVHFKALGE